MSKALLTREQAESIENWLKTYAGGKEELIKTHITDAEWVDECEALNGLPLDTLCRSLYVGYEIEPSPEEKIKKYFKELQDNSFVCQQEVEGVLRTLNILNLKVKGVNC